MTTMLVLSFVIFFAAVLFQGLFAGYETGFILAKANPIRVRHMAEEEQAPRAMGLMRFFEQTDLILTMLLIGTNMGTVAGTVALSRGLDTIDSTGLLATFIAAPFVMILAEIIPKSVFLRHPVVLSLWLQPVMHLWHLIYLPLSYPVIVFIRVMQRLAGAQDATALSPLMSSIEDLRSLVDESADRGSIDPQEQKMIHSVIDLRNTAAREVMTPRIDIDALPKTATRAELFECFAETGRTRIPVYEETIDKVAGIVNVYDVLMDTHVDGERIERYVRPVKHVPDSINVGDLLRELRTDQQHIAIVTDEYGGTDGMITIEDILEEIFGDIQDEHDVEEKRLVRIAANTYIVDARIPLDEAAEALALDITDDTVETVGGWITHLAGHIPVKGEVLEAEGVRVTVLDAEETHVSRLRMELTGRPEALHESQE